MTSQSGNLVGGGIPLPQKTNVLTKVCLNARQSIVEKQTGADPNLPGPGQYINPLLEGRGRDGEVKAILSSQRGIPCVKFGNVHANSKARSLAKPGSEYEPGPGQYVDPLKEGRDDSGAVKAILSNQRGSRSTVWFHKGVSRAIFAAGGRGVPGPGSYIRPLTDGRGSSGEVKGVPGVKFGRPKSASDATRRPNMVAISRRADDTPGPGAYVRIMLQI